MKVLDWQVGVNLNYLYYLYYKIFDRITINNLLGNKT